MPVLRLLRLYFIYAMPCLSEKVKILAVFEHRILTLTFMICLIGNEAAFLIWHKVVKTYAMVLVS